MDDTMTQDSTQTQDTATDSTTNDTTQKDSTLLSESTQQTTDKTQKTQDTVLTQPVSIVKPDGTFIEGWRDKLPENIRNEECLTLVTDFPEMVKQFVNQRKAIGKNKVAIPTDKDDESTWNSFYESIGRPKTETGYNVPEIPEELKEVYSEPTLEAAKKFAYGIGITQKQFDAYLKFDIDRTMKTIAEQDEYEMKAAREAKLNAEKELRAELGAAYDERMHIANRLITEAIPKESARVEFIEKYGNDTSIIRLLSNIGARMSEDKAIIGELTQKTPTELDDRIKKLETDPRYLNRNSDMSPDERQAVANELRELYQKRYPSKK